MKRELRLERQSWPIAGEFRISRGARTEVEVVVVEVVEGEAVGRGEGVPHARFGESPESVAGALRALAAEVGRGLGRDELRGVLRPGAARNALDCALWDLEAGLSGHPVWRLAGLPEPRPVLTAFTLSLADPETMGEAARRNADRPLLKLKVTGEGDVERVGAVRRAAPSARLVVDANEAWSPAELEELPPPLAALGVELVEQPLPAGADEALGAGPRPIPVCADESCRDAASVAPLVGRYDFVNVKLDKAGGLTEAVEVVSRARAAGLGVMVGCMVGTSLSMAPALLLAQLADLVDLDGALLLARDRPAGIRYEGSLAHPPAAELWGSGARGRVTLGGCAGGSRA